MAMSFPRACLIGINLLFAAAAYIADWNHTHIHNPRWPPHAKFHNGQSMSVGLFAALTAVYLLVKNDFNNRQLQRELLFAATVVGCLTPLAGLSAIFYPGTAWTDPEWETGALIGIQGYIFSGHLMISWLLYGWEKGRLEEVKRE